MTVVVEDYYQHAGFTRVVQPDRWKRFETRVEANTRRALDLLREHDVRATFFVLGWIAEQMPQVVRAIVAEGHEVATKGHLHRPLDSSFYPRLASIAGQPWRRYIHRHRSGPREIVEVPLASVGVPWLSVPAAGGNYTFASCSATCRGATRACSRRAPARSLPREAWGAPRCSCGARSRAATSRTCSIPLRSRASSRCRRWSTGVNSAATTWSICPATWPPTILSSGRPTRPCARPSSPRSSSVLNGTSNVNEAVTLAERAALAFRDERFGEDLPEVR